LLIIFTLGLQIPTYRYVKMTTPEIPSLSNGVNAASPPLVVVGGIAFIGKREVF
jgi:hypothetical protein